MSEAAKFEPHEIATSFCPGCNYLMDRASNMNCEGSPKEGSLTVCLNCGQLLMFNADLSMRRLSAEEVKDVMRDEETWATIEKAQFFIRQRGPIRTQDNLPIQEQI